MWSLLKKEVSEFFSSVTGYIVIIVFLTVVSLFMWIFPGETNVLDSGFASLDTLFQIAPWVFLFLVPAVTMRLIAEERRTGTLEILLTKPLTETQIILAKYFSALIIVILALLPTLIYFVSIHYFLSDHKVDVAGTFGSYIGLIFLAAVYSAIGLFSSSLTSNQVVAFISGAVISFIFYIGFQSLSLLKFWGSFAYVIDYLGINEHYQSISRGVIDSRDVIYFLSLIVFFLLLTKLKLESRKW